MAKDFSKTLRPYSPIIVVSILVGVFLLLIYGQGRYDAIVGHSATVEIPESVDYSMRILNKREQYETAPDLDDASAFFNTGGRPLSLEDMSGSSVVLVEFWTYTCLECRS
jgi:hypothetical protein